MLRKLNSPVAAGLLFLGILCMSPVSAKADLITFEFDPIQTQLPNGFRSVESNLVSFSANRINTLHIHPASFGFGNQVFFGTRGLATEDDLGVVMNFDVPVTSLSLWFGNDHFGDTVEGDTAILQTFLDGVFVGETILVLNRDSIINQQILFSGALFNRATFRVASNDDIVETIDNIEFTPIPEPASLALLAIGVTGVAARLRRRNSTQ